MKIAEVKHSSFAGRNFTTLTFAENVPKSSWRAVVIDGERIEPVFDSSISDRLDRLTFPGRIDPDAPAVEFVA